MSGQKICTALCALVFSTIAFADEIITTASKEYALPPNQPLVISNILWWQANIQCVVKTPDAKNSLTSTMKKKSATINGLLIAEGQSANIMVRNKDVIYISADSGAQVEIINHGPSTIMANCSL